MKLENMTKKELIAMLEKKDNTNNDLYEILSDRIKYKEIVKNIVIEFTKENYTNIDVFCEHIDFISELNDQLTIYDTKDIQKVMVKLESNFDINYIDTKDKKADTILNNIDIDLIDNNSDIQKKFKFDYFESKKLVSFFKSIMSKDGKKQKKESKIRNILKNTINKLEVLPITKDNKKMLSDNLAQYNLILNLFNSVIENVKNDTINKSYGYNSFFNDNFSQKSFNVLNDFNKSLYKK